MKIVAILQSRMTSTRLPRKAMIDIAGKPLTEWIVERVANCQSLDELVLAIPSEPSDDPLADYFSDCCTIYRGSLSDVLDRFLGAAQLAKADIIVRITGDNPLLDPDVMDEAVNQFMNLNIDYGSTSDCPLGIGAEVFTIATLSRAHQEATEAYQREHVTPYCYESPGRFKTRKLDVQRHLYGLPKDKVRLTVDTLEDLELIREIFLRLLCKSAKFGLKEISELFRQDPNLFKKNIHIRQKNFKETENR